MAFSGDPHSIPYSTPTSWITVMTRLSFTRESICMEVMCVIRSVMHRVQVLRANEWLWCGHPSPAILQVEGVWRRTEWKHHAVSDCAVPKDLSVLGLGCLLHIRNSIMSTSSTPSMSKLAHSPILALPRLHVVATHPRLVQVALRRRWQLPPFRRVISWSQSSHLVCPCCCACACWMVAIRWYLFLSLLFLQSILP